MSVAPANPTDDLVRRATVAVDRSRLVSLLVSLIDIPSPTGKEAEIAKAYQAMLAGAGMDAHLQPIGDGRYNAVGMLEGAGGGRTLMFNGHLDTSFGGEMADRGIGFRTAGTVVDDEWVYGMGAFNMKNALAAYVVAVEAIRKAGIALAGDVIVAGVAGEIEKAPVGRFEDSSYLGYGIGTKHLVTHGGVADACILGEPTNLKVVPGHCGSAWIKIEVPGVLIHTAWSTLENNAILRSSAILRALEQWIPEYQRRHAKGNFMPKVNIAAIEGGWPWRGARTPDSCALYLDVRTTPEMQPIEVLRELRAFVAEVNDAHPGLDAKAKLYVSNPGTAIPDDHEIVSQVVAAHAAELGSPPELSTEVWCSDAAHLNRYGVPTINYGAAGRVRTGGEGWSPQQGEHVHIGDLEAITRVYVRTILSVCGTVD